MVQLHHPLLDLLDQEYRLQSVATINSQQPLQLTRSGALGEQVAIKEEEIQATQVGILID